MASEDVIIKELEQQAYTALLRSLYSNPRQATDMFRVDRFLTEARGMLSISNDLHSECMAAVKQDLELIKQGQRPAPVRKYGTPGSLPPGQPAYERAGPAAEAWSAGTAPSEISAQPSRGGRGKAKKPKGAKRPIGAPGSSRGRGRPLSGPARALSTLGRTPSVARARSTRSAGAVDPNGYVGRRIWRYYADEDRQRPWVEGFIVEYDDATNTYKIAYDPNDPKETLEEFFDVTITSPEEFVLGEHVDLTRQHGSRRQAEKPEPVQVLPQQLVSAPSKRRRASIKVPPGAPFMKDWFASAIADGTHDDLQQMLDLLELREKEIVRDLEQTDMGGVSAEELQQRAELERQFVELCRREEELWVEYKGHLDALAE